MEEYEDTRQDAAVAKTATPWWRKPAVVALVIGLVIIGAVAVGIMLGRGATNTPVSAAAAASATPLVAQSSSAPTDTPSTSECAQFAQVYNGKVGPALKAPSSGANNVFWTTQADAFQALVDVLNTGADPYSQTLAQDATAVASSDRQYDADGSGYAALGTFNNDLKPFLDKCGMSGS